MAGARVTGPGPEQMRVLAAKLKTADPKLRRDLRRAFRNQAGPIVTDVQRSILAAAGFRSQASPMARRHGKRAKEEHPTALREEIAATVRAVTSITGAGVRLEIVSDGRRMPEGKGNMPAHTDSAKGWGHPVFARGERFTMGPSHARKYRGIPESERPLVHRGRWAWVREWGKPGWFESPVAKKGKDVQAACHDVLEATKRRLEV